MFVPMVFEEGDVFIYKMDCEEVKAWNACYVIYRDGSLWTIRRPGVIQPDAVDDKGNYLYDEADFTFCFNESELDFSDLSPRYP